MRWPTPATTRGRCRRGSATKTSSTRCATPSWPPTGSRTSGDRRSVSSRAQPLPYPPVQNDSGLAQKCHTQARTSTCAVKRSHLALLATNGFFGKCQNQPARLAPAAIAARATGVLERATYDGAPEGGVPVHRDCLAKFFDSFYGPFSAEVIVLRG